MKYIKKYEENYNFEYNEKDYVFINIKDMINKPDLPFAKIIKIPFLNYDTTDTIKVEIIMNNKIKETKLFTEDVVRYMEDDEIEEYKLIKKSIKYNL